MVDVSVVTLENGIDYTIIDSVINNNIKYMLLTNPKNVKDVCIRKIVKKNGEEFIGKLNSDEEFDNVLSLFLKKNEALFA